MQKGKKKNKRTNAEWLRIKEEYIRTGISYRALAEKHNVSFGTLQDRALREEWIKESVQNRDRIVTEIEKKRELENEKEAEEIVEIQKTERKYAKLMQQAAIESLIKEGRIDSELTPQERRSLSLIFKDAQEILYKSYRIPDQKEIGLKGVLQFIIESDDAKLMENDGLE